MKKTLLIIMIAFLLLVVATTASAEVHVKKGDTLYKIAQQHNLSLKELISLNPHIKNPNIIHIGDYIIVKSQHNKKKDLTDYARSLQDITAYKYGGNNFPYEVDCSAWVQGIYKKFGVTLPRTSRQQALTGQPVTFKELQLGDLMFFSTAPDKTITHVGIYLGNDYWISNLNEQKDVEILSTWGRWTQDYFLWGSRYEI